MTRDHTVPASALLKSLQQLQRIVHLLAMQAEKKEVRQRARLTHEIEKRFPLICGIPQDGGYALPVEIGDPSHRLFDEQVIVDVARTTRRVLSAVNSGDRAEFYEVVPDRYFRRNILKAFQAMQPSARSGLIVHVEDWHHQKLLDGLGAQDGLNALMARPEPDLSATPAFVTGALTKMEFQERRMQLKLLGTGKALEASYGDDFEPVLLEHPRALIQVHGNVLYGEDGQPASISDVDEILDVDESPIEVSSVPYRQKKLRARTALTFNVEFDAESQTYEAMGPFGVVIAATVRPELEASLDAELAMLWDEYALAKPEDLTSAARKLREELLGCFEEEVDDA